VYENEIKNSLNLNSMKEIENNRAKKRILDLLLTVDQIKKHEDEVIPFDGYCF
jgi:hypothetical protein